MRSTKTIMAVVLLLSSLQINLSQQGSPSLPLTNKDISDMTKMGLSDEIILAKIKTSICKFDTSIESLKELKAAGVSNSIMLSMVESSIPQPDQTKAPTKALTLKSPPFEETYQPMPSKNGRAWLRGLIRDTDNESFTTHGGTTTQGRIDDYGNMSATTNRSSWNHKKFSFVVEGKDYIYVVSHVISFRWSKEVHVTVNAPVFYAVDGDKFYLLDEKEREFKLKIQKKILKNKE